MKKIVLYLLCVFPFVLSAQESVKDMVFSSSILAGARSSKIPLASSETGSGLPQNSFNAAASQKKENRKRITILRFSGSSTSLSGEQKKKLEEIKKRSLYNKSTIYSIECFGEDVRANEARCKNALDVLSDEIIYYIPTPRRILTDDPQEKETIKIMEN